MKFFLFLSIVGTLLLSSSECDKKKTNPEILKGRLEIKGICLNYTLKVLEGNVDTSLIDTKWTDENTTKEYTNVFGLQNPCSFPQNLNIGDEFSFSIDTALKNDCMKCEAYYPTPSRKLNIKVVTN